MLGSSSGFAELELSKQKCTLAMVARFGLWPAQAVVQGDARVNRRAQIKGGNGGSVLTPEEQADCLLDQATDGGILGRTWVGWRSWL